MQVQRLQAPVTVLPGGDPGELAAATSRTLFTRSPAVVVAAAGEEERAAATARERGVPLLPAGDAAAAEVRRLGATEVLTAGAGAAAWAGEAFASEGPRVAELGAATGSASRPRPAPDLLVLTDGSPAQAAAAATAQAAGAVVRALPGGDPRADAQLVADLAARPPARVVALGDTFGPVERLTARLAAATAGAQVPGGGQLPVAGRRIVALYGHPGTPGLGVLGEQDAQGAVERARRVAAEYDGLGGLPAVPGMEIIATVASGSPGPDGDFSNEVPAETLRPWVEAAEAAGIYVVLDLQCGRSDCAEQAPLYADLLRRPHVGLAVDPEWRLHGDERPLQQIGSMHAEEINRVAAWLAELTRAERLPQKVFVVHQFRHSMIRERHLLDTGHDELAVVLHADGHGTPGQKMDTWNALTARTPPGALWAWKNFYDEDRPTFTPAQTAAVQPSPVFVSYQ
ncbi:hypothetical protein NUM3379_39610 [Kineococcus sp. NUM-3379]